MWETRRTRAPLTLPGRVVPWSYCQLMEQPPTRSAVRSPDIIDLRSLCAAAELGSLGRAAIRLRISQPALSKRLHNLEALVGWNCLSARHTG